MSPAARAITVVLVGICIAAVAVPTDAPDAVASWLAARQFDWQMRARTTRLRCPWYRSVFCQKLPLLAGPLGPAADSALFGVDRLTCQQWPITEPWGDACRTRKADTTLTLMFERGGRVVNLARLWTPVHARSAYDALRSSLESRLGPGHLCPQSDDLGVTEHRRWQLDTHTEGIHFLGGSMLVLDQALGKVGEAC
jgi:hypothetical protein